MHIQTFLQQVKALNTRYEKINQLTGENFNIFKILKLHTSEVKLHSSFLAELLNPNGSHGHKDMFLKLFVQLFLPKDNEFDPGKAYVEIEKHLGLMNEFKTEGGRIDILVSDSNRNHIVIENKIYAADQEKQLARYKYHYPKADLFYLTLDGRVCEEAQKEGLICDEDYKCISYKYDIAKWLELCRKEAVTNPVLRETISQYLHLIKYLCNQAINDTMSEELSDLINTNLEAAFTVANNLDAAKDKLIEKLKQDVTLLAKEFETLGFEFKCNLNLHNRDTGFWFHKKDWVHAGIGFQFQEHGKALAYGIATFKDMRTNQIPEELKTRLFQLGGTIHKTDWWPISFKFEDPYNKDWTTSFEPWVAVANGDMTQSIRTKMYEMIKLIDDLKL